MPIRFRLNERWVEISDASPTLTLLRYLRDKAHLTATKEGCAEGDCGACCVAVLEHDAWGRPTYRSVNSCLVLLPMLQGKTVFTAEGIGQSAHPHLVQETLAKNLGSQCGYCTPGVVMSLFEACYRPLEDVREAWQQDSQMCGNLCRCTGYRPIRETCSAVAGKRPDDRFWELLQNTSRESMQLSYAQGAQKYFTPDSEQALWPLLREHPTARLVAGGTDLSLEVTKRFAELPTVISLEGISTLRSLTEHSDHVFVGAGITLTDLEQFSDKHWIPLQRMLRYFGSRPIKSRATVGGNLCNASPIGDLPPVLIALGATAVIRSAQGDRRIPLESFFISYRKTALTPGDILAGVEIPYLSATQRAGAYKVSKRQELDISAVSAGFCIELDSQSIIRSARLAYGGMAATPARARHAEAVLTNQPWSHATADAAAAALEKDFQPISDHRASAWYRQRVARNLLEGFFEETARGSQAPFPNEGHTGTVLPVLEVSSPTRA